MSFAHGLRPEFRFLNELCVVLGCSCNIHRTELIEQMGYGIKNVDTNLRTAQLSISRMLAYFANVRPLYQMND